MDRLPVAARAVGLAVLSVSALAACSDFGGKGNTYTCPTAITSPDLQTIANIAPGNDPTNVLSAGQITRVSSTCGRETAGIEAKVEINFNAMRTNTAVTQITLPYFVAFADNDGNVLGKREFNIAVKFPPNEVSAPALEKITAHLPLKNQQLGNIYTIVVGFQLTQAELSFNRAHLK